MHFTLSPAVPNFNSFVLKVNWLAIVFQVLYPVGMVFALYILAATTLRHTLVGDHCTIHGMLPIHGKCALFSHERWLRT